MNYRLLRNVLFRLSPERAHTITLNTLRVLDRIGMLKALMPAVVEDPITLFGLRFRNGAGLAAGLDKNGAYIDALAGLGFGFIEVGTVTPQAQKGNPEPRLFRLPEHRALINRMGFNNDGLEVLVRNVRSARYKGVLGINIGKNKDTSAEDTLTDYVLGLNAVYPHADYVTINISSPNTPGLRDLQFGKSLDTLLEGLKAAQSRLSRDHERYVPLVLKIAPDLTDDEVDTVAERLRVHAIDGVIATNTTLSRAGTEGNPLARESGGLSGAPMTHRATEILRGLRRALGPDFPIIASGGVMSASDAKAKMEAGANLVQIYTGLIYEGPELVPACARAVSACAGRSSVAAVTQTATAP